jgi:hypothetical protein
MEYQRQCPQKKCPLDEERHRKTYIEAKTGAGCKPSQVKSVK